jgi:hypothetical protein
MPRPRAVRKPIPFGNQATHRVAWFVFGTARVRDGLEAVEPAPGDSGETRGDLTPVAGAQGFLAEGDGGEGLPVPREPAYDAKRSQDGEAPAASE